MGNQSAGLFGGLLIGFGILAGAFWVSPSARAWVVSKISGSSATPAASTTTPAAGGGNSNDGYSPSMFYGATNAAYTNPSQPYQLGVGSQGVQISTAALIPSNEAALIPLPSLPPLAPTSPQLLYT